MIFAISKVVAGVLMSQVVAVAFYRYVTGQSEGEYIAGDIIPIVIAGLMGYCLAFLGLAEGVMRASKMVDELLTAIDKPASSTEQETDSGN